MNLGTHIQLKLQPAVIYCHVTKGVQKAALRLLSHRITEHSLGSDTRITMKHGPKGKYRYYVWITTKEMKQMNVDKMMEKLLHITKKRTRAITIIIKQSILQGPIHDIWSSQYSLL